MFWIRVCPTGMYGACECVPEVCSNVSQGKRMVCPSKSLKMCIRDMSVCHGDRSISECASQCALCVFECAVVLYMHACVSTHTNLHKHPSRVSLCVYPACREYAQVWVYPMVNWMYVLQACQCESVLHVCIPCVSQIYLTETKPPNWTWRVIESRVTLLHLARPLMHPWVIWYLNGHTISQIDVSELPIRSMPT